MNIYEETKFLMKKYNINANKNLGQNFLISEQVVNEINKKIGGKECALIMDEDHAVYYIDM